MKSKLTLLVIVLMAIALHAYKAFQTSGITGRLSSKNANGTVWAIQGTDSVRTFTSNGVFMLEAKPGIYTLVIDAIQPYKSVLIESIEVIPGKITDLGELQTSQ